MQYIIVIYFLEVIIYQHSVFERHTINPIQWIFLLNPHQKILHFQYLLVLMTVILFPSYISNLAVRHIIVENVKLHFSYSQVELGVI